MTPAVAARGPSGGGGAGRGPSHVAVVGAGDRALGHRLGSATVTVRDGRGSPLPGRELMVEQARHAFGFGNIGFDLVAFANGEPIGQGIDRAGGELLARLWLDLFDRVTLPFYWARFEPRRGAPDTARLRRAARWFVERGVAVKGHPLVWHTLAPPWLADDPLAEVEAAVRARVRREVSDFASLIDVWDFINEVVIMPDFAKEPNAVTRLARARGRVEMVRMACETARDTPTPPHSSS